MKNTHKLFMLGLMLLGVAGVNCKDSPAEVKAYESGSYATFKEGTLEIGDISSEDFIKITITNDANDLKENPIAGSPFEVGCESSSMTNGCHLGAYVYNNEEDASKYDCVIYADVDTIYANNSIGDINSVIATGELTICGMFSGYTYLTELNMSKLNTSRVTNMFGMFFSCTSLVTLDLSNFDTSNVTDMGFMFCMCSVTELDLSNFNTSKIEDMFGMFYFCANLTELNLSSFDTSNVIYMNSMFDFCQGLTTLDVSNFNTSNVTNMDSMFSSCSSLTTLDLSNFDTRNVISMDGMFNESIRLTSINLSSFDTSNVTNMSHMFKDCRSLKTLDLSNFDMSNVTDLNGIFHFSFLKLIKTPKKLGNNTINLSQVHEVSVTFKDYSNNTIVNSIDSGVENKVLVVESTELNNLITTINELNMCEDIAQAPTLRKQYDSLDVIYQEVFNTLKNEEGALLIDKLEHMERYYEIELRKETDAGNQMIKTLVSNDYNIITIAVLTLTSFIGIAGYYFIQKRKNIKA